jgi:tRNA(Ile)-lysidine synthetase-like protein
MSNILAEDFTALELSVDAAWKMCVMEERDDRIAFSPSELGHQPLGIRRQLMRRAITLLLPNVRDVDFNSVNHSLNFLEEQLVLENGDPFVHQDLFAGLRLVFERQRESRHLPALERFWILNHDQPAYAQLPQMDPSASIPLKLPVEIILGRWRLKGEMCEDVAAAQMETAVNKDFFQAWVDIGNLFPTDFVLRTRRPGERFKPLGMEGRSLKMSDFMINVKLPQPARRAYPLACLQDQVIWVPGYNIAHDFRLTSESKHIIHFWMICEG